MTYLGIDYGQARIGLAISPEPYIVALPYKTIANKSNENADENVGQKAILEIIQIINQLQVKKIFIGKPISLDGKNSLAVKRIEDWINQEFQPLLEKRLSKNHLLPKIHLIDERMTTVLASKNLAKVGKNAQKQKLYIDQVAAAEILDFAISKFASSS
ncbi:MAG: Holliday junction resolvase RuvX [Bifidobacteriaceae bacterium]|jgi:putative Holliday junction resolvase|nr:Holliday junction resolvase RuvX [Bifidobacteriaceae bacterium]